MSKIKNMKLRYKVAAGFATTAAVVGMGGAAFAYFTSTNSGSGTGSVGSNTAWSVSGVAVNGGALNPGQGTDTVYAVVQNPSGGNQGLNALTVTIEAPTNLNSNYASETNQCSAADFALSGTGWTISADGDTATLTNASAVDIQAGHYVVGNADSGTTGNALPTLNIAMNDLQHPQDSCQGAQINVTVQAS